MKKDKLQTIWEHIEDLRKRVIYCTLFFFATFCVSYYFKEEILQFLFLPLLNAEPSTSLIYTNITELFFFFLLTCLKISLLFTIPFFIIQAWQFVKPALKENEKKSILPILILSPLLFLTGITFCYFAIMPVIIEFFTTFNAEISTNIHIQLFQNIQEYFSFFMSLLLAFGLCFQLPIILTFLIKLNIITVNVLKKFRKYFIILAFTIGAILTPPDVISQTLLSIPLVILYELTLLFVKKK